MSGEQLRKTRTPSRMSYQLYRNTTLGATLQESLDELMQLQMLSPALALRVLIQFDKSINNALATRVKNKLHFKADKLNTYRFCDNVWTFMLKEVEFRENSELAKVHLNNLFFFHVSYLT